MGFLDIAPKALASKGMEAAADKAMDKPALPAAVQQQQDSMKQWFNDTSIGQALEPLQSFGADLKQQGENLRDQGQNWFMQTAPGQMVNTFKSNIEQPLNDVAARSRAQYETDLNHYYRNAMNKLGF